MHMQIIKSKEDGRNLQSAVFSECAYATTLANIYGLSQCEDYSDSHFEIEQVVLNDLKKHCFVPRYIYFNDGCNDFILQAGGCGSVDLMFFHNGEMIFIECKEPYARTSEPNLPKYLDDGKISITSEFAVKYPQFEKMLSEQNCLNFFETGNSNVNNFSNDSIVHAVSNNYADPNKIAKNADYILTESKNGMLVLIKPSDFPVFAKIEGEIRPAGKNHCSPWCTMKLMNDLNAKGASISFDKSTALIEKSKLEIIGKRGSSNVASRYKISRFFFVYLSDCKDAGNGYISIDISKIQQLIPTICAKTDIRKLDYSTVKNYYFSKN